MRKHPLLITVAATALLAGVSIASAQQRQDQQGASEPKGAPVQKGPTGTSGRAPAEPKAKDVQQPDAPK